MTPFFDWLGREWGAILSWWALTTVGAIAVYPLVFRLLRGLPSRGYAMARAAGMILIGYLFWILNILGLLRNDAGNVAFTAIILFIIGVISYATWRDREPILPWLRDHLGLILTTEAIFALAFFAWAVVRALKPDIIATEKPMEMAFLSATRRSATFPPNDPWMSGYAISYYHFGYIMIASLANLSGVTNGIAFNLSASLLFALTCVGAFSVGYDLVKARQIEQRVVERRARISPFIVGLLAVVLVALMGNLATAAVEVPYQTKALPDSYFQFMDIKNRDPRDADCQQSGHFPSNCYWWWFTFSRVVYDRDLSGSPREIITEFPQFSFILSDVHPHVLSLPFVLLALGLMLNLVLNRRGLRFWELLLYVVCIGGLIFLNSWDLVFVGLLIGTEALRRLIRNGTGGYTREDWLSIAGFGALVVLLTGILYLPFFISFRSQAGGIIPNLIYPTRFQQFLVMFGTFAFIIAAFVGAEVWRARKTFNFALAAQILLYGAVLLLVLLIAGGIVAWTRPDIRQAVFQVVDESGGLAAAIPAILARRGQGLLTLAFVLALIFGVVGRLFAREPRIAPDTPREARQVITYSPSTAFTLLLIGAGAVLVLVPEFAYLRDNFGTRINTIFKLYYQTWIIWGVASAYAVWSLLDDIVEFRVPTSLRTAFAVGAAALIAAGLLYTPYAIYQRAIVESGRNAQNANEAMTLDGASVLAVGADDYAAITCLSKAVQGDRAVLVEAMIEASAYQAQYGRVSVLSGIPTLLGWPNHEGQWRGDSYYAAAGTRLQDIQTLYNTTDWKEVERIVKKYGIKYVYVGPTERSTFTESGGIAKFDSLSPVCQSGNVAVYPTDSMFSTASDLKAGG